MERSVDSDQNLQPTDDSARPGEQGPALPRADVELVLDEESGVLTARIVPADEPAALDLEGLRARVEAEGYAELSFQGDAFNGILRHLQNEAFGDYQVARRVDAEVSVDLTPDRLQALLTTTRAYGGIPVTEERIRKGFAKAGIRDEYSLADAIAEAVGRDAVSNVVVAQGVPPEAGNDSRYELLVDLEAEVRHPRENEQGRVDHYLSREFVIVEPGTPLLRFYPATRGKAGRDVTGKAVNAKDGKSKPLPKDTPGVCPDAEDGDLMVAEYKGHPVVIPGGIRVDKTLVMDYADLRTGNVDFDGSVLVKGDVSAGVLVKATGDVHVKGSVENASVEAGGDVHVARGITGSEGAMNGGPRTVHVQATRDVHAAFAGGVHLHAGRDVVVKEYLSHCETVADRRVLIGQKGGRGLVVGGTCHGSGGVAGRLAGTVATVPTRIGAGAHEQVREAHRETAEAGAALAEQLEQLRQALKGMVERARGGNDSGDNVRSMVEKVRRTVAEFERQAERNKQRLAGLDRELEAARDATVSFSGPIHAGVTVYIGEATLAIRNQASGGRFSYREGEISWD